MNGLVIIPGGSSLRGTRLKEALKCMTAWRREHGITRWEREPLWDDDDGYYGFHVWHVVNGNACHHEVLIPGIPLAKMLLGPMRSPRLYVDGNSWLWEFSRLTCEADQ